MVGNLKKAVGVLMEEPQLSVQENHSIWATITIGEKGKIPEMEPPKSVVP